MGGLEWDWVVGDGIVWKVFTGVKESEHLSLVTFCGMIVIMFGCMRWHVQGSGGNGVMLNHFCLSDVVC